MNIRGTFLDEITHGETDTLTFSPLFTQGKRILCLTNPVLAVKNQESHVIANCSPALACTRKCHPSGVRNDISGFFLE